MQILSCFNKHPDKCEVTKQPTVFIHDVGESH